ncbi:glycosyltransferase [Pontibacter sp. E15-1]|uniref:glycosyltransferase n=1 Tax=Pontibacter sp. E15-1 TaxID=2919918 RepID=UPI001F4FE98E|nr:glycosyltransferase [Pontibacter sp. E15-1]MCJ8164428.1 glycosyltransferase [Pontibacter sp. E15-1]
MTYQPFVSVIIPTYHDWARLSLCINALNNQTYPNDKYEVIMINNDPRDEAPAGYTLPANFKLISEGKPGSYAARNAGLALAKGELIGFTDSDCIPHPTWIENAVSMFGTGEVDRIAGKIELIYKDVNDKTWVELYESIYSFNQKKAVAVLKASVTANLFSRKALFDKVGGFDASKKSGEDIGWNRRANAAGFNLVYGDKVVINHPARSTFKEFRNQKLREFGGKKEFKLNSLKGIVKNALFIPYLFYNLVISKTIVLFSQVKQLSVLEKVKVAGVHLYLYLIIVPEFIRLLFGGERVR